MSKILQKLMLYFRKEYVASLKKYPVNPHTEVVDKKVYANLGKEIQEQIDVYVKFVGNLKNQTQQEISEWEKLASDNQTNNVLGYDSMVREPAKEQVTAHTKKLERLEDDTILYLVSFDKVLTTRKAMFELKRIGLLPANLIETVLFAQKYKLIKNFPIIALEAYLDEDKKIGVLKNDLYCLCLLDNDYFVKFNNLGDIEHNEFLGHEFREGVEFLVKAL